jgi:hypothetical protein
MSPLIHATRFPLRQISTRTSIALAGPSGAVGAGTG